MTNYSLVKADKFSFRNDMGNISVKIFTISAVCGIIHQPCFADNANATRGKIFCFPAKNVPKMVKRLDKIEAKRRDVVDVKLDPKFLIKDGGVWPNAFYLARENKMVTDMPFSREDGRVPSFIDAVNAAPDTDICVADPTRADRPVDDEGLYFEMGLSPLFLTTTGEHDIAEIKEGSRDAKSFYKKMIPAPLRMFMPDTNYLAVKYKDPKYLEADAQPQIFARIDDKDIPLDYERHKEMFVVSGKDLQKMSASALIVRGGAYDLQPVPSPSTMRRFGWGKKDNAEISDNDLELITAEDSNK